MDTGIYLYLRNAILRRSSTVSAWKLVNQQVRHSLPTRNIFTRGITTLIIQIQRATRLYTVKLLVLSIMQPSGHVQISHIPSPNFLGSCMIHQPCMLTQLSTCCATSRELSIFISSFQGKVINLPNLMVMPTRTTPMTKMTVSLYPVTVISSSTTVLPSPIPQRVSPSLHFQLWKRKPSLSTTLQRKHNGYAVFV